MKRRDFAKLSLGAGAGLHIMPSNFVNLESNIPFKKSDFGNDFKWGVASASYQIEGAWNEDGKGPSIWDTFTHKKGKIKNNDNGDVACDFYHRYAEDIERVKSMNFDVKRFSISWPRIFPKGTGEINQAGVDFYHRVIDTCLEQGVEPWITCFHWDLPQALEDKGGWTNREVLKWFNEYVTFLAKEYGAKVKNWMILNEPASFTALGYLAGMHAPGKIAPQKFLRAAHYATICQAEGGRIIRSIIPDANIGTTVSMSAVHPKKQTKAHMKAAARMDAMLNRLFLDPILGKGYPTDAWKFLKGIHKYVEEGDMEKVKFDFDFIGLQNYFRVVAKYDWFPPIMWANQVKAKKLTNNPDDITEMNWEVYPEGIYELIMRLTNEYKIKRILVTENGAAFPDTVEETGVHDSKRVSYYQRYLEQVLRAIKEGAPVHGYFAWTLMDNFEWAEGYHPRFGLVHVDFKTQKRTIKDSGLWFREFLKD